MTKKLFLCCIGLLFFSMHVVAQEGEYKWCAVVDSEQRVPVADIAYLLFADGSDYFAIVQKNNRAIDGITTLTFTNAPASVEGVKNENSEVAIYPNPVVSQLTLQGLPAGEVVRVVSLNGELVIDTRATGEKTTLHVEALPAGMYLLQTQKTTLKFVKK